MYILFKRKRIPKYHTNITIKYASMYNKLTIANVFSYLPANESNNFFRNQYYCSVAKLSQTIWYELVQGLEISLVRIANSFQRLFNALYLRLNELCTGLEITCVHRDWSVDWLRETFTLRLAHELTHIYNISHIFNSWRRRIYFRIFVSGNGKYWFLQGIVLNNWIENRGREGKGGKERSFKICYKQGI